MEQSLATGATAERCARRHVQAKVALPPPPPVIQPRILKYDLPVNHRNRSPFASPDRTYPPPPPPPPQDVDLLPQRAPSSSYAARLLNALLFPGLPQVLNQPFVLQHAAIGCLLLLAATMGWIQFCQQHFVPQGAVATTQEDNGAVVSDYLKFWPLAVHVASFVHMLGMG